MTHENCWPPHQGHVAYIKKPPTSFSALDYIHNSTEQKNKSEQCYCRQNRLMLCFLQTNERESINFFSAIKWVEENNVTNWDQQYK